MAGPKLQTAFCGKLCANYCLMTITVQLIAYKWFDAMQVCVMLSGIIEMSFPF